MTPVSLNSFLLCVFAPLRDKECLTQSRKVAKRTGLMQDLLTRKIPVKADESEEITP